MSEKYSETGKFRPFPWIEKRKKNLNDIRYYQLIDSIFRYISIAINCKNNGSIFLRKKMSSDSCGQFAEFFPNCKPLPPTHQPHSLIP